MAEPPRMDPASLDPMGLWREMLGQWERGLNGIANQATGSSEFTGAMHQLTAMSLRMQQTAGEAMERSLRALNLPSRTDILALHDRLGRIEEALERLAPEPPANAQAAAPPARTRKPPSA